MTEGKGQTVFCYLKPDNRLRGRWAQQRPDTRHLTPKRNPHFANHLQNSTLAEF